jgi:hypothetical protein
MAKKRGKRTGLRARSKNARAKKKTDLKTVTVTLTLEQRAAIEEIALYACVDIHTVCAVMMGTAIYQANRSPEPSHYHNLRNQLRRARACMEANDPGNALDIFGPPLAAKAEGETAKQEAPHAEG